MHVPHCVSSMVPRLEKTHLMSSWSSLGFSSAFSYPIKYTVNFMGGMSNRYSSLDTIIYKHSTLLACTNANNKTNKQNGSTYNWSVLLVPDHTWLFHMYAHTCTYLATIVMLCKSVNRCCHIMQIHNKHMPR